MTRQIFVCALLGFFAGTANAQNSGDGGNVLSQQGSDASYELGLDIGNLFPNQVAGVTEIKGLGGVRTGFRLAPLSYGEFDFVTGNGQGQQWRDLSASVRIDIPVENLMGIAYIGADANYFRGRNDGERLIFGGHAGGGLLAHLGGPCWVRADMKFNVSPGTSLYISLGLTWRLGGGTSG